MAPRMGMSSGQQSDLIDIDGDVQREEKLSPAASFVESLKDAEDGAGMIPFRTSRRLQGVIYRMIQEQSESGSKISSALTTVKQSATPSSKVSLKRQHSPSKLIDLSQAIPEDREDETFDETLNMEEINRRISKKKSKQSGSMVHFADPICQVIVKKEIAETVESINQLPVSKNVDRQPKSAHEETKAGVKGAKAARSLGKNDQPKQRPMSCLDLLCNHVGRRGWRCYRSTVEGKSFCSYHLDQTAPAASFDTGISQTLCT